VNEQSSEFVEIFLQEASERLQFLREYAGILQDPYPQAQDIERLYIAAHTLGGTSASYGFPLFSEVAGKLAHIFLYAMNATIGQDAGGPLVEFISEAIAVLETDLLMISANGVEAAEDIGVFKQKYPFAFQAAPQPAPQPSAPVQDQSAAPENQRPAWAEPEVAPLLRRWGRATGDSRVLCPGGGGAFAGGNRLPLVTGNQS
jgi:chemotaxis protein histidine kinase CheA